MYTDNIQYGHTRSICRWIFSSRPPVNYAPSVDDDHPRTHPSILTARVIGLRLLSSHHHVSISDEKLTSEKICVNIDNCERDRVVTTSYEKILQSFTVTHFTAQCTWRSQTFAHLITTCRRLWPFFNCKRFSARPNQILDYTVNFL